MKRFYEFLQREEILQVMGIVFLFVGLITSGAVLFVLSQMSDGAKSAYHAQHGTLLYWLFIMIPSITIPIAVGAIKLAIVVVRQRRAARG